ncbi:hypothetical protein N0V83_002478 [Neocucurbitaria cava]|uniref:Uncharacterized protein n=1 Tax=Neocucurbitaria cava TaxID=798079 RepID=A0A9W8YET2_9PLEO|nr:hypothetical protein N0V83_002478 [Neocucurbitaria cava]
MVNDILPHVHWLLAEVWRFDPTATVLLASVPMMGYPQDDGSEWFVAQKSIIEFNAQLAQIANYYARHGRKIVYVHLSATQRFRLKLNPYVPNPEGYHRIAYDFLNGLIQANERGFFDGDEWNANAANVERPSYELQPLHDNEVTNGIKCHQKRDSSAPDYDTITKSLFRGAKDQEDYINNYACKKEFICKFSWDAEVSGPHLETCSMLTCFLLYRRSILPHSIHSAMEKLALPLVEMGLPISRLINSSFGGKTSKTIWVIGAKTI